MISTSYNDLVCAIKVSIYQLKTAQEAIAPSAAHLSHSNGFFTASTKHIITVMPLFWTKMNRLKTNVSKHYYSSTR